MVDAATVDAAMGARRAQQRTNTAKARAQGGTPPATNEARDSWITHHEREKKKSRKRQLDDLVDVEVDKENAEPGLLIQKNRQCLFCF